MTPRNAWIGDLETVFRLWTTKKEAEDDSTLIPRHDLFNISYPEVHSSLLRRHNQFLSTLAHLSSSRPDAKRFLTSLLASGLRFIFTHFDIAVAASTEAYKMSEFYKDIEANISDEIHQGNDAFGGQNFISSAPIMYSSSLQ
ncbi:MAG: hypothetical protein Q9166_003759 [cf. Caloplaca sp. 2 TL-2023]